VLGHPDIWRFMLPSFAADSAKPSILHVFADRRFKDVVFLEFLKAKVLDSDLTGFSLITLK
jgi:hypothetical protein